jgi:hypothetical protein
MGQPTGGSNLRQTTAEQFERLSAAFFAELERRFS